MSKMSEMLDVTKKFEKLKNTLRHSYTSEGRHESVAEHSWRMALMALLLCDEFKTVDMDKVIKMCLLHDLGEIFIGDILSFYKTEGDAQKEREYLMLWLDSMQGNYGEEIKTVMTEFYEGNSVEAKICSALDKMETVLQHNEASIETWSKEEYEVLLKYGDEQVGFSRCLSSMREELKRETQKKIDYMRF